jgi:hypothetical protein
MAAFTHSVEIAEREENAHPLDRTPIADGSISSSHMQD